MTCWFRTQLRALLVIELSLSPQWAPRGPLCDGRNPPTLLPMFTIPCIDWMILHCFIMPAWSFRVHPVVHAPVSCVFEMWKYNRNLQQTAHFTDDGRSDRWKVCREVSLLALAVTFIGHEVIPETRPATWLARPSTYVNSDVIPGAKVGLFRIRANCSQNFTIEVRCNWSRIKCAWNHVQLEVRKIRKDLHSVFC